MSKKANRILATFRGLGSQKNLDGMARYGIKIDQAFGVPMQEVKALIRAHKNDHALALELWDTGWREGRLLGAQIADPRQVTESLMEAWVQDFNSWDVCDTTSMQLFCRTPFAVDKALKWSTSDQEFVRRSAFAMMAGLALKRSRLPDEAYEPFLERTLACATDERNQVKKAVNWALRQIGKRNLALNAKAIATAEAILSLDSKAARWIAKDALRELRSEKIQNRLKEST